MMDKIYKISISRLIGDVDYEGTPESDDGYMRATKGGTLRNVVVGTEFSVQEMRPDTEKASKDRKEAYAAVSVANKIYNLYGEDRITCPTSISAELVEVGEASTYEVEEVLQKTLPAGHYLDFFVQIHRGMNRNTVKICTSSSAELVEHSKFHKYGWNQVELTDSLTADEDTADYLVSVLEEHLQIQIDW